MKLKKMLALGLVMVMSLSVLVGCIKDKDEDDDANSSEPSVSKPVSSDETKAATGQVTAVYDAVMTSIFGEEHSLMAQEDMVQIEEMFGLTEDMMKEFYIALPMMNVQVDTFIGVEANEGKVKEVETALNAYKDRIIADREAFPYLPDHLPKAKAAQVVVFDDYVFYLSLGYVSDDVTDEAMQESMDKEVEKAVEAVKETLKK